MKKIMILLMAFDLCKAVSAQDKMHDKMSSSDKMMKMHKSDCVMMEDGKMMVMKGDRTMAMNEDMTMSNGAMVMKDGAVKMKIGKTMMLKDGQCVYMNGKVGTMKPDKMKGDKM